MGTWPRKEWIKLCTEAKPDKLAIVKRPNFFLTSTSYQLTYQSPDDFNDQENWFKHTYKKKIRLTKIAAAISFIFFGWKKKKVEQLAKLLTWIWILTRRNLKELSRSHQLDNAFIRNSSQPPQRYGREVPDAIRGRNLDQAFVGDLAAPAASW